MTVFGSHGRAGTDDFAAGDVGYVPQGFGHYTENTGDTDLELVLSSTTRPINRTDHLLDYRTDHLLDILRPRTSRSPPISRSQWRP
jgi:hypothetical protein